jgi:hypothetical protein
VYLLHTLLIPAVYQVFRLTLVSCGKEIPEGTPPISRDLLGIDNEVFNASMITRAQSNKALLSRRLKPSSNLAAPRLIAQPVNKSVPGKMGLATEINISISFPFSLSRSEIVPYYPTVMYKLPANLGINFRHPRCSGDRSQRFRDWNPNSERRTRRVRVREGRGWIGTS